MIQSQRLCS